METVLPDRALVLLRYGDLEGNFDGDGSRIVGSIVMTAVNTGCNREFVRSLLADPQHPGGFCALRRRRRNLDAWFDREWDRAAAKAKASPPVGDRHEATVRSTELIDHVDELGDWRGTGGASDRSVFLASLRIAQRSGRLGNLALSCREVGELAKVGRDTAGKAMHRLADRGLLRCTSASSGTDAARWEITGGDVGRTLSTHRSRGWYPCVRVASPPSDTWRWAGLGHATRRVHEHLSEDAVSAQCLATALGVTKRTVQRHLAKLADIGLADRTEDGWIRDEADPVDVEEELGVKGMTEKQHEDHVLERKRRADARARFASTSSAPFVVDPETGEIVDLTAQSKLPAGGKFCRDSGAVRKQDAVPLSDSQLMAVAA